MSFVTDVPNRFDKASASEFARSAPKRAVAALALGLQWLMTRLPWAVQRGAGALVGHVAARVATRRSAIVDDNLAAAFPDWSQSRRDALRARHFRELGIGIAQVGMAWWAGDRRLARLVDIEGLEHLPAGPDAPATLLVSGHFTTLDLCARAISLYGPVDLVHRALGEPAADAVTRWRRGRFAARLVDKRQPRAIVASMRERRTVWIAIDQADTTSGAVEAPFFGRPALTNTTASRLAGRHSACVLPVCCVRTPDGRFRVRIEPPLEGFGHDATADAARLNAIVEQHARATPEQYFWIHRRFKRERSSAA
ncbi:MAG: lysophospholipid acyltransferase family protein [Pseudomonadota bacterium]